MGAFVKVHGTVLANSGTSVSISAPTAITGNILLGMTAHRNYVTFEDPVTNWNTVVSSNSEGSGSHGSVVYSRIADGISDTYSTTWDLSHRNYSVLLEFSGNNSGVPDSTSDFSFQSITGSAFRTGVYVPPQTNMIMLFVLTVRNQALTSGFTSLWGATVGNDYTNSTTTATESDHSASARPEVIVTYKDVAPTFAMNSEFIISSAVNGTGYGVYINDSGVSPAGASYVFDSGAWAEASPNILSGAAWVPAVPQILDTGSWNPAG